MAIFLLHNDAKSSDPYKIRARLEELLKGIPREGNLNFGSFDLATGLSAFHEAVESAMTIPFLGGTRTIVATNAKAVERAFPTADQDTEQEDTPEAGAAVLRSVERLSVLPKDAKFILVEENGHLDGRSRFYKALVKLGCKPEVFKGTWFDPASGDTGNVVGMVQEEAGRRGLRLSADLAERFAMLVGSDTGTLIKEIEKLVLYAGPGAKLTAEDIESVVTPSYEAGVFQLVDYMGFGNIGKAVASLQDLLDHGAAPPYILTMIARQIRLIARVREAMDSGVPYSDLASALKEAPFVIRKIQQQTRTFPDFSYPVYLEYLTETDVHLKRGTMPPKLALETLIVKMVARDT
jgi:DNA polymerase-3 subunit delta